MADWINDPQGREEIEKVTKELKLPVWKANYKGKFRDFWNELWDKIEDYILKLKGDTEKNSKGLNDRLVSAVGKHDGDFPIANAVVGNVYYSDLTKKYYKCKVGGPAPMPNGNFIDLSILENLNRLENLIKIKKYSATTQDYISINAGTLIISESRIDNLKNKIGIPLNSTIVSVSTGQSAGYCEYCTYNYESDTAIVGHIVPSGNSRTVVINVAYI
jgi:hypothetical protein|nr:MAG TPA: hypothetical protein [Caudoviricetes sp.]